MKSVSTTLEKTSLCLCLIMALLAITFGEQLSLILPPIIQAVISFIGQYLFFLVNLILLGILILAISPLGSKKMGGSSAHVEFSTLGWLSMLFAAGMGSGLVFWGVAEPALHSIDPPLKQNMYPNRIANSLAVTLVNWGAHAWALYAVFGLVLGGLTRSSGKPGDSVSPVLSAVGTRRAKLYKREISFIVKLISIFAIFFGVVGTIANSTLLIGKGIELELGIHNQPVIAAIILSVLLFVYTLSAKLGLKKGVQSLSIFNVMLAFLLLAMLAFIVPLEPIWNIAIDGTSYYLQLMITGTWQFESQLNQPNWAVFWTYNYYFWWLAWGPFVGVFLAKISYGRPVRHYILGVVFIPTLITIVWFSVFSGAAIEWDKIHQSGILEAIKQDYTQGLFVFFKQMGFEGGVFIWLSLLLLLIFVATSADSAILVMRQLAGNIRPTWLLYIWSFALVLTSYALLIEQNEPLNRSIAVIGAFPFLGIFILQLVGFIKEFIVDMRAN